MEKPIPEDRTLDKEEVKKRIDKQDPNNNKNLPENPLVEKDGKSERDDGFEHRTSAETAS